MTEFENRLSCIIDGKKSLYVLDLSWLLHRYYHAYANMSIDIDGYQRPTGHIYGVLNTIKMIRQNDSNCAIIICQDGTPVERNEIMASTGVGYKEGRPELEFNFYTDVPAIKACAMAIRGVFWAYNDDKESDDLMYCLARRAVQLKDDIKVYVHSGDNDLLQSIDEHTVVIRHMGDNGWEEINEEVVTTDERFTKKFHGVPPKYLPNFRAICGDSSDKIKGIYRFPREIAKRIAESQQYLEECCAFAPINDREYKWYREFEENQETVQRNLKLMRLTSNFDVNITKPIPKKEAVQDLISRFQLNSWKSYLQEEKYL